MIELNNFNCSLCQKKVKNGEGFFGYFKNGNLTIKCHSNCLIPKSELASLEKEKVKIITCP